LAFGEGVRAVIFATTDLRSCLLDELATASQADVAVAYFCPEPATLAALQAVPRLRLLVSNNFQINNPDSLEALHQNGKWVRAISPEEHGGNLHAKVYLITRKDGSLWALVGSANLTRSGLISNQEACILLDSKDQADAVQLRAVRRWINDLRARNLPEIDFELAKSVYQTQNWQHNRSSVATVDTRHWALKPGERGEFWQNWLAENVVSIGWRGLPDTSHMNRLEAVASYRAALPSESEGQAKRNVPQILSFTQSMQTGQLVLVCGRYDAVGAIDRDVYIYGVARTIEVNGQCYYFDVQSTWHQCKRHARIQRVEQSLPRSYFAQALQRGSFVPTIMQLDQQRFSALEAVLQSELGVVLGV
jgi:HKD family nuclease